MNDETAMTKGRSRSISPARCGFVIRHWRLIRHSNFVIRHSP